MFETRKNENKKYFQCMLAVFLYKGGIINDIRQLHVEAASVLLSAQ